MGMDFKGIIPGMLGHRIDAAVSGMYITPERLQVADFIPYALIGNQLVVQKGNPKHVTDRASLCGLKVAVPVSTQFEGVREAGECRLRDEGQAGDRPAVPAGQHAGRAGVAARPGRCGADSTATIAAMMAQNPGVYELAGDPFDTNTKLGIGLRKDDPR